MHVPRNAGAHWMIEAARGYSVGREASKTQWPIPVLDMASDTEVMILTAPENNPNTLTLGPIFNGLRKLEEIHVTRSGVPALGAHSFWGLNRLRILNLLGLVYFGIVLVAHGHYLTWH